MINRPDYIAAIEPFIDKPLVKILAGIRRCGKSTIFEMLREELHLLAAKLMHMIAPGAGETQSGFGWVRSMQMALSRMPRTRAFLF